jgi:hypothetical protein
MARSGFFVDLGSRILLWPSQSIVDADCSGDAVMILDDEGLHLGVAGEALETLSETTSQSTAFARIQQHNGRTCIVDNGSAQSYPLPMGALGGSRIRLFADRCAVAWWEDKVIYRWQPPNRPQIAGQSLTPIEDVDAGAWPLLVVRTKEDNYILHKERFHPFSGQFVLHPYKCRLLIHNEGDLIRADFERGSYSLLETSHVPEEALGEAGEAAYLGVDQRVHVGEATLHWADCLQGPAGCNGERIFGPGPRLIDLEGNCLWRSPSIECEDLYIAADGFLVQTPTSLLWLSNRGDAEELLVLQDGIIELEQIDSKTFAVHGESGAVEVEVPSPVTESIPETRTLMGLEIDGEHLCPNGSWVWNWDGMLAWLPR